MRNADKEGRRLAAGILRQYDIRGRVGEDLVAADLEVIGRCFGTLVVEKGGGTVAVGYDGRLSSPELERALVAGLAAAGVTVYRIGLGPTPMLYFADRVLETDGAMMITGSHNPPDYNGIKMVLGHKPFFGDDIQRLGHMAETGHFATGTGQVVERSVMEDYVARLVEEGEDGLGTLTVAWDAGNGATGEVLRRLVAGLPGEHLLLNEVIDGTFPAHHPDPTIEANLAELRAVVAREDCDLGIAFDGDGDRIGVIDAEGEIIWGDQLLCVLAREVLARQPGARVIADVKASGVFFDEIRRLGGEPVMWKTGHSLIKSKMAEEGVPLAGEMSGHLFFADRWYGFDDALYAAVRLLKVLSGSDETLAAIRRSLPVMLNTPELRFDCADERKFAVIDEVRDRLARVAGLEVSDLDGVRVTTPDGWWLLRASNTQAVLVARAESSTPEGLERLKAQLAEQVSASGLAVPDFSQSAGH